MAVANKRLEGKVAIVTGGTYDIDSGQQFVEG